MAKPTRVRVLEFQTAKQIESLMKAAKKHYARYLKIAENAEKTNDFKKADRYRRLAHRDIIMAVERASALEQALLAKKVGAALKQLKKKRK